VKRAFLVGIALALASCGGSPPVVHHEDPDNHPVTDNLTTPPHVDPPQSAAARDIHFPPIARSPRRRATSTSRRSRATRRATASS
jgi:hypothetical protein